MGPSSPAPKLADRSVRSGRGLVLGLLGATGFSGTAVASRVAVADLNPVLVGLGRALIAGALAIAVLALRKERLPARRLGSLALVALGSVVVSPLSIALAVQWVPASHVVVVFGVLPAATAVLAVVRGRERPSTGFWLAAAAGLVAVVAFAVARGAGRLHTADLVLLLGVAATAVGHAEGGILARELGGWRVICWALVLVLPFLAPVVAWIIVRWGMHAGAWAWVGFGYVSLISMFLAFFAWYAGLAVGGVARVSQLQLAIPVFGLLWSALLLGERLGAETIAAALAVMLSVAATQRARVDIPVLRRNRTGG